ncbi:MAG: hypothetical protein R6V62_02795 [Candidatus Fermentibacteraceae bacterium]
MKRAIPANLVVAVLATLLQATCGGTGKPDGQKADQGSGVLGAVGAVNDIATPPVPTEVIHDARDAAAAANAHIETVDSILGSQ